MKSKMAPCASPSKGNFPVAISYKTIPKENESVRGPRRSPRICSGDISETVPSTLPAAVSWSSIVRVGNVVRWLSRGWSTDPILARPKLRILACPREVTNKFAGLMSRWMIPAECAASNPLGSRFRSWQRCSPGPRRDVERGRRRALRGLIQGEVHVDLSDDFDRRSIQHRGLVLPAAHGFQSSVHQQRRTADHAQVFD